MINYFLTYRPFHVAYSTEIIKAKFTDGDNRLINHYDTKDDEQLRFYYSKIVQVPSNFIARKNTIKTALDELKACIHQGKEVQVFIPHTLGVLANYVYFKLAKRYANLKVHVFYEGVIVFYPYEHSYSKNIKFYATRYFSGFVTGIPYTLHKRLLELNDSRIHKIYSPILNIDADSSKIEYVPLPKINYEIQKGVAIILGLSLGNAFEEEAKRCIGAMYDRIQGEGIHTVYFKDHPSEKSPLFKEIAEEKGIVLKPIVDNSPIESLIKNYQPQWVFSIWSSAMINLSVTLPMEVKLVCYMTPIALKEVGATPLIDVFIKQGIEVNTVM